MNCGMHHQRRLSDQRPFAWPPRLAALGSLLLIVFPVGLAWAAEDVAPYGLQTRIRWTTSRLVGSPDPPLPYTVEKTFTNLTWKSPIYIVDEPGTDRMLVVLQGGAADKPSRIVSIKDDPATSASELFFEVPGRLLYSLCFDPGYADNGQVFVFSNGPTAADERTNRISRYMVDRQGPHRIEAASEEVLLEWRSRGHDGGDMGFGPDGMFYLTTGDGTSDSDEWNSGQTLDDLLGSVLRIDVHRRDGPLPYAVPADNPFVNTPGARGEIWAYGLRNPWRMSFDAKTGHLWVGNNGQDLWETAHLVRRGENYGWSVYEGSHSFYPERRRGPTPLVAPTIEHSHAEFRSLTGGVVVHSPKLAELNGAYVYGDYSSGRIWGMKHDGQRVEWHRELADTSLQIAAFHVDRQGELLIADHGGGLYRLVPAPKSESTAPFPTRLSDTGLFASTAEHRVEQGLIPYSVNVAGWADGATAERYMALPEGSRIEYNSSESWGFADGTALVQTLFLERRPGDAATRFRVETRVLLRQDGEWAGYSYRWNDEQTDATLVDKQGADIQLASHGSDGGRPSAWRFPSRGECMACHARQARFVLGLSEAQLNRDHDYPQARDNQLRALDHIGMFKGGLPKPAHELSKLAGLADESYDVEARVRAYLHVNCAICHVENGGGNSKMNLTMATARDRMNLISARPQHDTFAIENAMLLAPGDPERSVLVQRLSRRGRGQMPPLVSNRVDERAVALVRSWISQLKPDKPIVQSWRMQDLLPALDEVKAGRSLEKGKTAFRETGCVQCHRFDGEGGTVGPDLSTVGKKVAARELLESIIEPSKIVADEYANYLIQTEDGDLVSGRVDREDESVLVLRGASATDPPIAIAKSNIAARKRLDTSNMPAGMVNVLEREQVLDLLAYLLSSGQVAAAGSP